jgi:hypothetical protein
MPGSHLDLEVVAGLSLVFVSGFYSFAKVHVFKQNIGRNHSAWAYGPENQIIYIIIVIIASNCW